MKAAERGEPQAHTLVGRIYAEGLGTPPNAPLAAQWFARGAELGDPEAMFASAMLLAQGRGVEKDRAEAARQFEARPHSVHPLANYNLALLFMQGDGKPENPYRALMHMRYAAESGVADCAIRSRHHVRHRHRHRPQRLRGREWIGKAAAAGIAEAQLDYAVILFRGHGVPPDAKRGAEYFRAGGGEGRGNGAEPAGPLLYARRRRAAGPLEAAKWNLIAKAGGVEDEALDKLLARSRADLARRRRPRCSGATASACGLD